MVGVYEPASVELLAWAVCFLPPQHQTAPIKKVDQAGHGGSLALRRVEAGKSGVQGQPGLQDCLKQKITEQEGHFCPESPEAVAKAFAGPAPSQSSEACHPWPPREQGRQEVSGCPLLLALGLAYTWRLETHQETGAWVEPVCRRLCNIWQPCPF